MKTKSNFAPPEQAINLPIKIDTEFMWIKKLNELKWHIMKRSAFFVPSRRLKSFCWIPAATLEELLSICPSKVDGYELGFSKDSVWYADECDVLMDKTNADLKQAVIQMIEWCVENNYIKVEK